MAKSPQEEPVTPSFEETDQPQKSSVSLITKEGWYFILSVLALMINSYAMSFQNPNSIRKSILITSPMVLAYDCFVLSVGGAVYESVAIISAIILIVIYIVVAQFFLMLGKSGAINPIFAGLAPTIAFIVAGAWRLLSGRS